VSEEAVRKLTVAAAAQALGVPERSLFRAVEKGHVPSTKRDGVTVVDPADVEAWAARRAAAQVAGATAPPAAATPQNPSTAAAMAGSLPAAHAPLAVGSGRSPLRAVLDGELTAHLIGRYKRGEGPVDVAEALRIPIPLALEGYEHFVRAKSATAPTPQDTRLDEFQVSIETVTADINGLMDAMNRLGREVAMLSARVTNMPVPARGDFKCSCGHTGWVAVHAQCTVCRANTTVGFHPQR
jgi:hypothetical protein